MVFDSEGQNRLVLSEEKWDPDVVVYTNEGISYFNFRIIIPLYCNFKMNV